jgi:hypothetical protein
MFNLMYMLRHLQVVYCILSHIVQYTHQLINFLHLFEQPSKIFEEKKYMCRIQWLPHPAVPQPLVSAPSCVAPTCAARSCAARSCAARSCAAPSFAAPSCAAPSCAAPSCAAARYEPMARYFSGVVSRLCICSLHAVVTVLFHARLKGQ